MYEMAFYPHTFCYKHKQWKTTEDPEGFESTVPSIGLILMCISLSSSINCRANVKVAEKRFYTSK